MLALLLIVVFPAIFLRPVKTGSWDEAAEIFGVTFILLGQLFRTSGRGYKSEHSREGQALIQGGPYNLVRNPMYLGILLIGLGIVLMLFEWWVVGIFLAVFITRYILLIFKEEKKLLALFPQDYPVYCRRVPRFLPSPNVLLESDIGAYLPLRPAWIKKEIGTVLAVLLVTLLLESWEDIQSEGVRVYLKESAGMFIIILLFVGLGIYLSRRTADIVKSDAANKS
jgi:protein-S-isoprenylcysteine O-methyltransferase Ste14